MIHRIRCRGVRTGILLLVTGLLCLCGCPKSTEKPPVKTQPAVVVETPPVSPTPPATQPPATLPATQPTSQPAADPPCTYSPDPPYTVNLFVREPEQKQPGWLRIEALIDPDVPATATGEFPRQNHVYVQAGNVQRMEIDIEFLPLAARKSVILHLDKQVIEVFRRPDRPKLTFDRRPTGEWVLVPRGG